MATHFILRFDDVTPQMAWSKFLPFKDFVESFRIKSILGVVPESLDPNLVVEPKRNDFFELIRGYSSFGDAIAQHGTNHTYDTTCPGMLGINNRSEFSGHSYSSQLEKIRKGKDILVNEGVWQPWFMAPAHSFDHNTIKALSALEFNAITDGYGFYPYEINSILLVPQMSSFPLRSGFGISTICLHINSMNDRDILKMKKFIIANHKQFVDFKDIVSYRAINHNIASISRHVSQILLKSFRKVKYK
jgi:predicted deacetylase